MNHIVLNADVVAARKISARPQLQEQLKNSLKKLNQRPEVNHHSPLTITLGDEFQAVYAQAKHIFADIIQLSLNIHPEKLRCAIGIGELVTPINSQQAIGMDGPAFHLARAAIEKQEKEKYYLATVGLPDDTQPLVTSVLQLISRQIFHWNRNRLAILTGLLQHKSVQEIAATLKISDKSVYKTINTSHARSICRSFLEITRLMDQTARES